ncbi:Selenide, water dikinase 2 [Sciurus carolinensis]|uniref:Selenide, water dikinase 2 n=1 Tax=Sciurus carolinensis TaxID=30640 RepID=A0AA41MPJ5_SCICA|nr:Selenide, water dikinase 2 [Sciurus carolinensis]
MAEAAVGACGEAMVASVATEGCVNLLRHRGLSLVQTADFFYTLVEDPYMMGHIACANVLSDLYTMGITECDNMLMLLSVSQSMNEEELEKQRNEVSFVIHNLLIIAKMAAISKASRQFGLLQRTFADTSGGLLICLSGEQAAQYCSEIKSSKYGEGYQAWIIGIVEKGNQRVHIIDKPQVIEVLPRGVTAGALAPDNSNASSELNS